MRTKLVFLVADGAAGQPLPQLGGRTTLSAARTPTMDAMAASGLTGLAYTVPEGMPPGSDVANMSLLGFDPAKHHTGRGPIEAAAQGLMLAPDDLCWRLNVVTVTEFGENGRMLDYSAGHIKTEVSRPLVARLGASCTKGDVVVHPGIQYRHLLVQKGGARLPEAGYDARPPHDITDQGIAQDIGNFKRFPALWEFLSCAAEKLAGPDNPSKANACWPWGQGAALTLPSFADAFGLRGAVVSAVDLVKGLGRAAGMEVLEVEGATGLVDTNYEGKLKAALDFLEGGGDFVFVHLEGPDEAGHMGSMEDKVEALSRIDERVLAPMKAALGGQAVFVVTCDHPTPVALRTHTGDPVPFVIWAEGMKGNGAKSFNEAQAASTGLEIRPGHELMARAAKVLKGEA